MSTRGRPWLAEARTLYESGLTCPEVAERMNMSPPTVYYGLRASGVKMRTFTETSAMLRRRRLEALDAVWGRYAEDLYRYGLCIAEVVEVLGLPLPVSIQHVRDVLELRGVAIRGRSAASQISSQVGHHLVRRDRKAADLDPATVDLYERRYRIFARWCAESGLDPAPTGPRAAERIEAAVAQFALERLAAGYAPRGVTAILAGVRFCLTRAGLPVPGAVCRLKANATAIADLLESA